MPRERVPAIARFYGRIAAVAECWQFPKTKVRPIFLRDDGTQTQAARYAYELHIGSVPAGYFVCHHCDNVLCVNPEHLYAGTAKENTRDMLARGRHRIDKPLFPDDRPCPSGHEPNWTRYVRREKGRNGWQTRVCRTCTKIKNARARARRKAAESKS